MYDSTIKEAAHISASRILDLGTRKSVIARDGGKCFLCNKKGIQVHEIVPRSHFGKETMRLCFSEKNRVCLCPSCHSKVHTFKWRRKLLKMLMLKYNYDYPEEKFRQYRLGENE